MTVATTIAHCPSCGIVESIFIRNDAGDDLTCRSTVRRRNEPPRLPTEPSFLRRIFRRRR